MCLILALMLLASFSVNSARADASLLLAKPATAMAFIKSLEQQAPTLKYDCRTYEEK